MARKQAASPILVVAPVLLLQLLAAPVWSFLPQVPLRFSHHALQMSSAEETTATAQNDELDRVKEDLVRCCTRPNKPLLAEVQGLVRELEDVAEQAGIGQASSISGLLTGEW